MVPGFLSSFFGAFLGGQSRHVTPPQKAERQQKPLEAPARGPEQPHIVAQSLEPIDNGKQWSNTTIRASGIGNAEQSSGGNKKRWLVEGQGFHAVKVGRKPGIYASWPAAKKQTNGYSGALHQKFDTLSEAEAFMEIEEEEELAEKEEEMDVVEVKIKQEQPDLSVIASNQVGKYYAVKRGRKPGIYTSWSDAQPQVWGFSRPRHKSFPTLEEAQELMAAGPVSRPSPWNRKRSVAEAPWEAKRRKVFAMATTSVEVEEIQGTTYSGRTQRGRKTEVIYIED
ncbi:Caulimovirus viroplasmin-domain-containing protein [Lophiotrema nucula]|uniref:Ribonuclease H n=1 Tax=Lophiotrema nucula TaxID=690887 RepID=A0A6A5YT34_9PLEO|nr:Caulimovirus viroplasmin-domain-containing protein [Lophiotrema nucula]